MNELNDYLIQGTNESPKLISAKVEAVTMTEAIHQYVEDNKLAIQATEDTPLKSFSFTITKYNKKVM